MYCSDCGSVVADGMDFCPACGKKVTESVSEEIAKRPLNGLQITLRVVGVMAYVMAGLCYAFILYGLLTRFYSFASQDAYFDETLRPMAIFAVAVSAAVLTVGIVARVKGARTSELVVWGIIPIAMAVAALILICIFP